MLTDKIELAEFPPIEDYAESLYSFRAEDYTDKILFDFGIAMLVFKYHFISASSLELTNLSLYILLVFVGRAACVSVLHKTSSLSMKGSC